MPTISFAQCLRLIMLYQKLKLASKFLFFAYLLYEEVPNYKMSLQLQDASYSHLN